VSRFAAGGCAIAMVMLAMWAVTQPDRVTPSHLETAREPAEAAPPMPPEPADATLDLYGNDVSPAVATYSFDALGSPYEVHSPQTELPRPGSPKT
jgi:hypothetical protein